MAQANLTWDPTLGAVSYTVEYKLAASGSWTLFSSSVTTTSATVTGLLDGNTYDFRVTTNCNTGSSGGTTITDSTPCLNVSGFSVSVSGTTASLQWNKLTSAVSYTIEYKLQSSGSWTTASGSPLTNSGAPNPVLFSIPGLSNGSAYDFRVKTVCTVGTSTGVTGSGSSACPNTTNLAVTFS